MSYFFTDEEISSLISEEKQYSGSIEEIMSYRESDGHKRSSVKLHRGDGSHFMIKLRLSLKNMYDFSAIISFQEKGSNKDFKLRRYNGKSHEHNNRLEKEKFYSFHIHQATERYQEAGRKEECYAEQTTRYADIKGALKCLLQDCNITIEVDPQTSLFEG